MLVDAGPLMGDFGFRNSLQGFQSRLLGVSWGDKAEATFKQ